jgi:hypothetical protein
MMLDRFTPAARRSLVRAATLAARSDRPYLGTDSLLVTLAGDSDMAVVLRRHGAGARAVGDAVARLWGWPAGAEDGARPAALGTEDEIRRHLPGGAETGGWRLARSRLRPQRLCLVGPGGRGGRVLSGQARKVIEVALWRAQGRGGPAGDADLLMGMLGDGASRSAQVLAGLRVCFTSLVDEIEARDLAA